MINLLPPQIKAELAFSKRNAKVVRYLWVLTGVIIITGGLFGATLVNLSVKSKQAAATARDKDEAIAEFRDLEDKARLLNSQLAIISKLEQGQTKFSVLLADLAKVTLRGTSITNLTLTGDDKKAVRVTALADNYAAAASLRDALAASPRIGAADIQSVAAAEGGGYRAEIVIGFKPGQAK